MHSIRLLFFFALSLVPNLASAGCESYLVDKPVEGLFESIPVATQLEFGDLNLRMINMVGVQPPWGIVYLSLLEPSSKLSMATAQRNFNAERTKMKLFSLRTRDQSQQIRHAPSFLKDTGAIDLVRGRGIPTSVFLTLHQMRVAGVSYGGLREVTTSEITNQVTAFELRHRPLIADWIKTHPTLALPASLIAAEVLNTSTGRYIKTTLTQAGLRITAVVVQGGRLKMIRDLVERKGPEIAIARRDLTLLDVVPINFIVTLEVAPY